MPYGLTDIELQKLQEVFLRNPHIKAVILYGSRAKWTYRPFSYVDITLVGEELTKRDLNRLMTDVDDLLLPYRFDISLLHTLKNEALREHIDRVGKLLFTHSDELDIPR